MKTNWQEIKEQVEIKVGEDLDPRSFKVWANEIISELNEIAYIEAAPQFYSGERLMQHDPENIFKVTDAIIGSAREGIHDTHVEYNFGHDQIELKVLKDGVENTDGKVHASEIENYNNITSKIKVTITDPTLTDFTPYTVFYKIKKLRTFNVTNPLYVDRKETVLIMPDNLSSVTKIEIIDDKQQNNIAIETSINSLEFGNTDSNNNVYENIYYISNGEIHLFSGNLPSKVVLYYIRRMSKVTNIGFEQQDVEMEPNYEVLLTLGITTKWWENYAGMKDSETKAMYQRYMLVKKEYEEKNMPRKMKRRQKHIRVY